jgi:hypothetical protein
VGKQAGIAVAGWAACPHRESWPKSLLALKRVRWSISPEQHPRSRSRWRVLSRLVVEGNIEVNASQKANDLPVVVRSAHGSAKSRLPALSAAACRMVGPRGFSRALLRPYLATTAPAIRHNDLLRAVTTISAVHFGSSLGDPLFRSSLLGLRSSLADNFVHRVPWSAGLPAGQPLAAPDVGGVDCVSANRRGVLWAVSLAAWRNGGNVSRESTELWMSTQSLDAQHTLDYDLQP